ncbi:YceI family protein [Rivibacter subsaxonicus]|uniref:Polyisoprenoid-binding protein YceI n=1 Tax=Rivibacter subsaxonicus TaxID=457575 RepID=A0A4Q7VWS1_9BURK|nr:YceI family protein [Rivibacter subsaxonicus]RZU01202.1 polyisoprenoid-binding protein YceI [Rivibacter subsaxonicus]
MKTLLTLGLALGASVALLAAPAPACAQVAKLVPAQSEVSFSVKQMGVPVEGKFTRFDAQVQLDPKKPETGKVGFTIDIASATMGNDESDAELPKAPWFNTAKFPQATFQSSAIKAVGPGKFEVAGKLSIKGNVRDVVVPVTLSQSGANSVATGGFAIKRLEFKIGEGEWTDTSMVANDVQVKFKLALSGMPPL